MNKFFTDINIAISKEQEIQFEQYYKLLIEENEKYNLTAITDYEDVVIKHFLDSVLINKLELDLKNKKMIDIGTGAGFPAIPIKIMNPTVSITCLDALNKRIGFLKMVQDQLNLSAIELIHGRAEDFGQMSQHREQYDYAVSRAVAELRLLLEFVMPFVKPGGYFIAYKSLKSDQELNDAENALKLMHTKLEKIAKIELPNGQGIRELLILRKTGNIAKKYPRKAGVPKKSPL